MGFSTEGGVGVNATKQSKLRLFQCSALFLVLGSCIEVDAAGEEDGGSDSSDTGALALIIVGVLLVLGVFVFLVVRHCQTRSDRNDSIKQFEIRDVRAEEVVPMGIGLPSMALQAPIFRPVSTNTVTESQRVALDTRNKIYATKARPLVGF